MSLLEDANFDNIPDKDPEITKEELIQCLLNEYRMATAKGVNGYLCLRRVEEQIAMKKELGDEVTEQDKWGRSAWTGSRKNTSKSPPSSKAS